MIQRKSFIFEGLKLSFLEYNPEASKTILFAHANGYSAGCYTFYFQELAKRGFRVIALDFSGHGYSDYNLNFKDWTLYRDQLLALITHLSLSDIYGIGHSMGGATMLLASVVEKKVYQGIIALDPVILNMPKILLSRIFGSTIARNAQKRRDTFPNLQVVKKAFRKFPVFRDWREDMFENYLESCFRETEEGLKLRCSPALEAKNFRSCGIQSYFHFGAIKTKTKIIIPENFEVCSPKAAHRILRGNSESSLILLKNGTHFFPFEKPDWTLQAILDFLGV
ncbi:MAG: alpha/beta hydrolase [Leptospiraceae bacterium]|nr:alpha/beta hydrolase [Leptospiraceae bacterium]MCP5495979.1 alpha/beta hydrolase [Leptospiraceae bacterium]